MALSNGNLDSYPSDVELTPLQIEEIAEILTRKMPLGHESIPYIITPYLNLGVITNLGIDIMGDALLNELDIDLLTIHINSNLIVAAYMRKINYPTS